MASEQFNRCARCALMVLKLKATSSLVVLLTAVLLLSALPDSAVAAPRRGRVISDSWQDPCYTDYSSGATPSKHALDIQQETSEYLNDHQRVMRVHLGSLVEKNIELEGALKARLPSMDELQDITIEGMAIGDLQYLTSDLEWLEVTQRTYELLARAYIYVDRMVQDENTLSPKSLRDPMQEMRDAIKDRLLCPMYVYTMNAHNNQHPVDDVTHAELMSTHRSLKSTDGGHRNERNYMVVRDLKRITDHMRYELYAS